MNKPIPDTTETNLNVILLPLITEMAENPNLSHTATYLETKTRLRDWRQQAVEVDRLQTRTELLAAVRLGLPEKRHVPLPDDSVVIHDFNAAIDQVTKLLDALA